MPKYNRGYIKQDLHDSLLLDKADATDVTTIETALATCTMEDVTADRALGTTYQNTSGKVMMATVTLSQAPGTGSADSRLYVQNSTPADDTMVGNLTGIGFTVIVHSITFIVPVGFYYRLTDSDLGNGETNIYKWFEWTLF